MKYAIRITMSGDIGSPGKRFDVFHVFYKRPRDMEIEHCGFTQDFTALKGAKATTFKTLKGAEAVRDRIEAKCKDIRKHLKTVGINRAFDVDVVVYDPLER